MLVKPLESLKRESALDGVHRAIVVDNEGGLGRIRVSIQDVFPDLDDNPDLIDSLPWIYPKVPVGQGGNTVGSGLEVPEVGAEVNVEFPYRDPHFGFYTHKWDSAATHAGELDEDYPDTYGKGDAAGNVIKVNKAEGSIEIRLASGLKITTDRDGNVVVATPGVITFQNPNGSVQMNIDPETGQITADSTAPQIITADLQIQSREVDVESDTWQEDITGDKQVQTGGPYLLKVGGSISESVIGNRDEVIGQGSTSIVGGSRSETVGLGYDMTVVSGLYTLLSLAGDIGLATLTASMVLGAGGTAALVGSLVLLGLGTSPQLLGDSTVQWLQTHTHPTGVGPSGPPNEASSAVQLMSHQCFLS